LIVVEIYHRDLIFILSGLVLSVGLANAKSKCRKETLCFRYRFSLVSVCVSSWCWCICVSEILCVCVSKRKLGGKRADSESNLEPNSGKFWILLAATTQKVNV